jgi:CheY-like chemotaxis protein
MMPAGAARSTKQLEANTMPLRLLVIEDRQSDYELLQEQLRRQGLDASCRRVETAVDIEAALAEDAWDAVITDYNVPGMGFQAIIAILRRRCPGLPVVLFSGYMGEDQAAELLKASVTDFVLKYRPARLGAAIRRAVEHAREQQTRQAAEAALRASEERLRLALDGAGLGLLRFDQATQTFHLDARAQALWGARAEVTFDVLRERMHPEDVQAMETAFILGNPASGDGRYVLVCRVRLARGGERRLLLRGRVAAAEAGEMQHPRELVALVQDVTGSRQSEADLVAGAQPL